MAVQAHSGNRSTHLRGSWLALARLAWISLSILAVVFYAASVLIDARQPLPVCSTPRAECDPLDLSVEDLEWIRARGLDTGLFIGFQFVVGLIFNLSFILVAVFIFWRRSNDWMAMLFSLTLLMLGANGFSSANELLLRSLPEWRLAVQILEGFPYLSLYLIIYIFPNGRFAPPWMGLVAMPLLLFTLIAMVAIPFSIAQWAVWGNLGFGIYSMIYRYRRVSSPQERQQTKWVAFGLSAVLVLIVVWAVGMISFSPERPSLARTYFVLIFDPLVSIAGTLLPICMAISILRYRLWDIDLLIRRTLQYTLLTGLLVLLYFGAVVTLQAGFRTLTGQTDSSLATVLSTLGIAALFNPLRNRVQDFIDRLFYRRRYDAERVLTTFASSVRDEIDMARLTNTLISTVEETVQPEHVSLWMREPVTKKQLG